MSPKRASSRLQSMPKTSYCDESSAVWSPSSSESSSEDSDDTQPMSDAVGHKRRKGLQKTATHSQGTALSPIELIDDECNDRSKESVLRLNSATETNGSAMGFATTTKTNAKSQIPFNPLSLSVSGKKRCLTQSTLSLVAQKGNELDDDVFNINAQLAAKECPYSIRVRQRIRRSVEKLRSPEKKPRIETTDSIASVGATATHNEIDGHMSNDVPITDRAVLNPEQSKITAKCANLGMFRSRDASYQNSPQTSKELEQQAVQLKLEVLQFKRDRCELAFQRDLEKFKLERVRTALLHELECNQGKLSYQDNLLKRYHEWKNLHGMASALIVRVCPEMKEIVDAYDEHDKNKEN